jgi:hypothetical protein
VGGVTAAFVEAVVQLGRRGFATLRGGLDPLEWVALAILVVLFVWGEGVRALERRWVPLMIERAASLRAEGARPIHRALAPLYAMSLVDGDLRRVARAWLGVALIVAAVFIVRAFPEPWRGITDLAVGLALSWGLIAIVRQAIDVSRVFDDF